MGLALFAISALSQPFHTLAHWFHPRRCTHSRSAVLHPARTACVCREGLSPASIATQSKPLPLKPASAASMAILAPDSLRSHSAARMQRATSDPARPGTSSLRSTLRPVRVLHPQSRSEAGRMVIAGRMADVCAELERMAACETWHH